MSLPTAFQYRRYTQILRTGGVIAYPTEAVFGLGCDPSNQNAVEHILKLKQRSPQKGLILIAADWQQLCPWLLPLAATQRQQVLATWQDTSQPAITWLLPTPNTTPYYLRGEHNTLAVRITHHPIAAALCRNAGFALVSTSANISRHPPCRSPITTRRTFGHALDAIVTGATGGAHKPSMIRSLDGRIIRAH